MQVLSLVSNFARLNPSVFSQLLLSISSKAWVFHIWEDSVRLLCLFWKIHCAPQQSLVFWAGFGVVTNANTCVIISSVFAGCQIPYPKREFLNEDEPEEKTEKVILRFCSCCMLHLLLKRLLPTLCICEPYLWVYPACSLSVCLWSVHALTP